MSPARHLRAASACLIFLFACAAPAFATGLGNGRLQIIHLDAGQGDAAVLISPGGQVVMFDDGTGGNGVLGISIPNQLKALGITHVDDHFTSHYHDDHIGGMPSIISAGITVGAGWDRGGSYTTQAYRNYVTALGSARRTMVKNQVVTLDSLSDHPVTIKCIDLAGAGQSSTEENTLSMVCRVSYGEYDESFGGDLPGQVSGSYKNIESTVGPEMGHIEVYKVHHHGSATSSWTDWLNATTPKIGVISEGVGNTYGHPTASALGRLHTAGVKTYWTEAGAGVAPVTGLDRVANGQIYISATWEPAGVDTIRGTGFADTFTNSGTALTDVIAPATHLISPVGGETWMAGSTHAITWNATDNVGVASVDLAWSADGGATWNGIATGIANTGSYAWGVPAQATAAGIARVRARDAAGNLGADSSSTDFSIDFWKVTATAGLGGTIDPSGVVNVVEGASRSFTIAPLSGCQIQDVVVDGASSGALTSWQFTNVTSHHTVAASFLDFTTPVVSLGSPRGGEQLAPGGTFAITWAASDNVGVDSVDVDLSTTGSSGPWLALARGLSNSGSWNWTVPALDADSARVRVTAYDHTGNSASAMSDSDFTIGSPSAGVGDSGPARLALAPPAPNPSAGGVNLRFSLPVEGQARIEVLDLAGRRVGQFAGIFSAGSHQWAWDGRNLGGDRASAGLYLVRLHTAQGTRTQRLILLR